jgi:nitrogen regulatory protein PII
LSVIHSNAHTGQTGDGVLWVTEVQEFRRLCTHPV